MSKDTILLMEANAGLRKYMKKYLTKCGYKVVARGDGADVLKQICYVQPDVILLDTELPGVNGYELCEQMRAEVAMPIIFISNRKKVEEKVRCFQVGGDDYLAKPFDFSELVARIDANLRQYRRGEQELLAKAQLIKHGGLEIDMARVQCLVDGELIDLPHKEMKLLLLLAKHPNRVWSAEHLYNQIWGFDYAGDVNTVKVHISRLRRKIERNPGKPKHIRTVRGFGYLFEVQ